MEAPPMPDFTNPTNVPPTETILYELLKQTQGGHVRRFICACGPKSGHFSLVCTELIFPVNARPVGSLPFREPESFLLAKEIEARAAEVLQQQIDSGWTHTR
jgi:hypothetical protein